MTFRIITGDVSDVLGNLAGPFDAALSDPPYGLSFMAHDWDHSVPGPDVWRLVLGVLRPSASLFAFGGARTFHRLVCGVEDAGFEIRDVLMWLYGSGFPKNYDISKWIDNAAVAKRFDGYGTALKPAYEPIVWAMAPRDGSFSNNATEHGVAGINIDAGRIEIDAPIERRSGSRSWFGSGEYTSYNDRGRWPANVILDEAAGAMLDAQTGELSSGLMAAGTQRAIGYRGGLGNQVENDTYGDSGASRFFYQGKASREEREAGLSEFRSAIVNDGRKTSFDNAYQRGDTRRRNVHPTVKPVDLCRYLAAMLLPPPREDGQPRRILVPFSGSGSEMIGALLAGWDEIVGIEIDPRYVEIAYARLDHWERYRVAKSERVEAEAAGQFDLFDPPA